MVYLQLQYSLEEINGMLLVYESYSLNSNRMFYRYAVYIIFYGTFYLEIFLLQLFPFKRKISNMTFTWLSLILHYQRRIFYYQSNIHLLTLKYMLWGWMNYMLLNSLSIIVHLNFYNLLECGCNELIYINEIITQFLKYNCQKEMRYSG